VAFLQISSDRKTPHYGYWQKNHPASHGKQRLQIPNNPNLPALAFYHQLKSRADELNAEWFRFRHRFWQYFRYLTVSVVGIVQYAMTLFFHLIIKL
jgi:hypothetical protein